jgi:hypothetical protein
MDEITKTENEWLDRATAKAIKAARKIATGNPKGLMMTPVGRLNDEQWGWIVAAVIFAWIEVRVEQAIAEGRDSEQTVRISGLSPDPCDVAVVRSILPELADAARIDWSQPLAAWPKDTMASFLMLAWKLISKAEIARDHGPGRILRKSAAGDEMAQDVPFDL